MLYPCPEKKSHCEAEYLTQRLGSLSALAEDLILGLISSTHMAPHNICDSCSRGFNAPFWYPPGLQVHGTHT